MVVKPSGVARLSLRMFESCVVLDGSQTFTNYDEFKNQFESCVVLDGSQTLQPLAAK